MTKSKINKQKKNNTKKTKKTGKRGLKVSASVTSPFFSGSLDYTRSVHSAPAAQSMSLNAGRQKQSSTSRGIRLIGSSMLCEVSYNTSGSNILQEFLMNVGLADIFPWMAQNARQYTKYRARIGFSFIPRAPTSTPGQIALLGDRNVTAQLPADFASAYSYEKAVVGSVWAPLAYGPLSTLDELYIRTGPVPSGQDPKTYDFGVFGVLVSPTGTTDPGGGLGNIVMDYEIDLLDAHVSEITSSSGIIYGSSAYMGRTFSSDPSLTITPFTTANTGNSSTVPDPMRTLFSNGETLGIPFQSEISSNGIQMVGLPRGKYIINFGFIGNFNNGTFSNFNVGNAQAVTAINFLAPVANSTAMVTLMRCFLTPPNGWGAVGSSFSYPQPIDGSTSQEFRYDVQIYVDNPTQAGSVAPGTTSTAYPDGWFSSLSTGVNYQFPQISGSSSIVTYDLWYATGTLMTQEVAGTINPVTGFIPAPSLTGELGRRRRKPRIQQFIRDVSQYSSSIPPSSYK